MLRSICSALIKIEDSMSLSTENYADMKSALKEALVELVQERRDLFRDLFREVLEEADFAEGKIPTIQSHLNADNTFEEDNKFEDNAFEEVVAREIAAFHELHPTLLQQYLGEFVAIQEQTVVDHDVEKLALYERIHNMYPNQFVLMRRVEDEPEPELHFRLTGCEIRWNRATNRN